MALLTSERLIGFEPQVVRREGFERRPAGAVNGEIVPSVDVPVMVTELAWSDGQHTVVVAMDDDQATNLAFRLAAGLDDEQRRLLGRELLGIVVSS